MGNPKGLFGTEYFGIPEVRVKEIADIVSEGFKEQLLPSSKLYDAPYDVTYDELVRKPFGANHNEELYGMYVFASCIATVKTSREWQEKMQKMMLSVAMHQA